MLGLFEQNMTWNPPTIASNDISLIGCGLRWDLPGAIKLLKNGSVSTDKMITHRFQIERIEEAFLTQQREVKAVKVMIDL